MGSDVYANGREVCCKAGDGKSICAFPDVCFTPPQTPATPPGVPIPYPNTGMAGDTTDGSSTVKIGGKEVMLKDRSHFKQSMGDEAGCAPKKGVVTSANRGKVFFTSWSMDVKIEGENVVRHLDTTTHNHNPPPGNTGPWPHVARMSPSLQNKPCAADCKSKPTQEDYDKVRKKTPSRAVKKSVNQHTPRTCAACGNAAPSLAADHIVPLKIISQMPGFGCLSFDNQKAIANSPDNFVGLCTSCNSSKCDKTWHHWKGVKSKGIQFSDAKRTHAREATNTQMVNLKNSIKNLPCG
jgi:uncharacterized Zn-binding protein involved in type VI secretion